MDLSPVPTQRGSHSACPCVLAPRGRGRSPGCRRSDPTDWRRCRPCGQSEAARGGGSGSGRSRRSRAARLPGHPHERHHVLFSPCLTLTLVTASSPLETTLDVLPKHTAGLLARLSGLFCGGRLEPYWDEPLRADSGQRRTWPNSKDATDSGPAASSPAGGGTPTSPEAQGRAAPGLPPAGGRRRREGCTPRSWLSNYPRRRAPGPGAAASASSSRAV